VSEAGKHACKEVGGTCVVTTDGYYIVSGICMVFGIIFLVAFVIPVAKKLQGTLVFGLFSWLY
jgi:MFS transporter, PAT family, solute carrier family 33 (acetyl-CoA transportor), member 1